MSVKLRYIEIPLDKPRKLRFTINALREIETEFGEGMLRIFDTKLLGWNHLITLIYFGLKHGEPEEFRKFSSIDKVADLVQKHWIDADKGSFKELLDLTLEGMKASGLLMIDETADKEVEEVDDPLGVS